MIVEFGMKPTDWSGTILMCHSGCKSSRPTTICKLGFAAGKI